MSLNVLHLLSSSWLGVGAESLMALPAEPTAASFMLQEVYVHTFSLGSLATKLSSRCLGSLAAEPEDSCCDVVASVGRG